MTSDQSERVHDDIRSVVQLSTRMNQLDLFRKTDKLNKGLPIDEPDPVPTTPDNTGLNLRMHDLQFRQLQLQGLRIGGGELKGQAGKIIGTMYRESQTMQEAQLHAARQRMVKLIQPLEGDEEFASEDEQTEPNGQTEPQHEYAYKPVIDTNL